MGILFMMPTWQAPSELWMTRMLGMLDGHIAAIACYQPPEQGPPGAALIRLDDRSEEGHARAEAGLLAAMRSPAVTSALVHYLPMALRYERVWAATDKPLFVHCHGYDVTWDLRKPEAPDRPHFPPDYPRAVHRLSRRATLIANSDSTASRLVAIGVPRRRIAIKPLGVPVPDRMPRRHEGTRIRILFLGRLLDCKGPDLLIAAFERACAAGLDGTLTFAGGGPLRADCERLCAASPFADRIEFLGEVDAAAGQELRRRADVFAAHSRLGPVTRQEEAFGVAFVEAMAAGLPICSARSGALPEVVGDGGILVTSGDVDAQAKALLDLSLDASLRQRLGEAGWRRARQRYSLDRERAALMDLLGLSRASALANAPGQPTP